MNKEDICVLPGTIQCAENYGYDGLDIWMDEKIKELPDVKVFIGHSLGASFILRSTINYHSKFIFVNPLLKKKTFPSSFYKLAQISYF